MGRTGLNANVQLTRLRAGFTIDNFHVPRRLTIAVALGFTDIAGANFFAQVNTDVMIGYFASFRLSDVERVRLAFENRANPGSNGGRLKRLAIIFEDFVADGMTGFGAEMTSELAGGVHLHTYGALAILEDFNRFFLMERKQIFKVKLICGDPGGIELLDGFANYAGS